MTQDGGGSELMFHCDYIIMIRAQADPSPSLPDEVPDLRMDMLLGQVHAPRMHNQMTLYEACSMYSRQSCDTTPRPLLLLMLQRRPLQDVSIRTCAAIAEDVQASAL
jgi:hypothetical protein